MKKCLKCKNVYDDDSLNFCLDDGEWLADLATDEPATAVIPSPNLTSEDPTRSFRSGDIPKESIRASFPETAGRSKTKLWLIAAVAAVLVAAGGFFGYFSSAGSGQIASIAVMPLV